MCNILFVVARLIMIIYKSQYNIHTFLVHVVDVIMYVQLTLNQV